MSYVIGVDLGGTKIEIGIVDQTGKILKHMRLETDVKGGAEAVEKQIFEGIRYIQLETALPIDGIGIGVAGQIQPRTGIVQFAPNLKWHHYPLGPHLATELQLPIFIVNDVRAITWGEWLFGAGQGCQNLICLFVGTGIGSGIILGNQMLIGCSNTCGEVGHMVIDFHGPVCTCGNHGCLETFAGGWGIAARAKEILKQNPTDIANATLLEMVKGNIEAMTARLVIEAYHQGDVIAQLVLQRALQALTAGCVSLVNAFNPCRLILGGGILDGLPEWMPLIEQGIQQSALKAALQSFAVVPAQLGKEVGVIGSAAVVFDQLKNKEK